MVYDIDRSIEKTKDSDRSDISELPKIRIQKLSNT